MISSSFLLRSTFRTEGRFMRKHPLPPTQQTNTWLAPTLHRQFYTPNSFLWPWQWLMTPNSRRVQDIHYTGLDLELNQIRSIFFFSWARKHFTILTYLGAFLSINLVSAQIWIWNKSGMSYAKLSQKSSIFFGLMGGYLSVGCHPQTFWGLPI